MTVTEAVEPGPYALSAGNKERWTLQWKELFDEVITSGLCTGCAGCVIACPHDVIGYEHGFTHQAVDLLGAAIAPKGTWNDYEIRVVGQHYSIFRNGVLVNEYRNPPDALFDPPRADDPGGAGRQHIHGYLGRYHNQICVVPEGREREFLGWMLPGMDKFSVVKVFASRIPHPGRLGLAPMLNPAGRIVGERAQLLHLAWRGPELTATGAQVDVRVVQTFEVA